VMNLLPDASSILYSVAVYTTRRARLTPIVIRPREKTPHKAIFWRLRSFRQLITKKGRINTARVSHLCYSKANGRYARRISVDQLRLQLIASALYEFHVENS
jgi:hypothetical protein